MTMISRQCFFQQVTGCEKHILDNTCIAECQKSARLTNSKEESYFVEKSEGNYNALYNESNFLNTDIITDIPNNFSNFLIDLQDIKTETQLFANKLELIKLFKSAIDGDSKSIEQLHRSISLSNNSQYQKGL
jgi:putative protease